jgi:hypothetical protein
MAQAVQTAASVDGETRQAGSRRWFALGRAALRQLGARPTPEPSPVGAEED